MESAAGAEFCRNKQEEVWKQKNTDGALCFRWEQMNGKKYTVWREELAGTRLFLWVEFNTDCGEEGVRYGGRVS